MAEGSVLVLMKAALRADWWKGEQPWARTEC